MIRGLLTSIMTHRSLSNSVPRGGNMPFTGLSPDAVTNVVRGYAEVDMDVDDEDINTIKDVKSTATKKDSLWSDEDYDEDPFFHALYHNNDADDTIINVSSETTKTTMRVDDELFEKFHERFFAHHDDKKDDHEPTEKVTLPLRDIFEETNSFE